MIRDEARFGYRCGIYDLTLPASPKPGKAVLRQEVEFALFVEEPLIVLGYRFGEGDHWEAVRFSWNDRPREEQTPPLDCLDRALLAVHFGSDDNGPSRNLTLTLDFTRALNDAVRDLGRCGSDPSAERRALATLRRRFPSVREMLPRAVARSAGMP